MPDSITIRDVVVIETAPAGTRLVVVKILTSDPDLHGVGCSTFTQRSRAVAEAIRGHLRGFLIGRDVSCIEDLWQQMMVNGYWRNGPVLNNAISGVDMALWDINAKRAGMPLYQLLGGRCRTGAAVYRHADGRDPGEVETNVRRWMEQGYRHVRVQMGGYGGHSTAAKRPEGSPPGAYFDPKAYARSVPRLLEHLRSALGWEIELLHDIHERLRPVDAVSLAKTVEPYGLFFLEDPLAPEDLEWFANIRQQCATPIAMGELFNHPREWTPLITGRLIDYLRMHISQMGGITPARKVAAMAEQFGVATAWHGPGDVSPVGHAANLHLDIACPNFGIQEWSGFPEPVQEVFPGCPTVRKGYMYPNDQPGLGIDIDENLAARWPCEDTVEQWTQTRTPDGTAVRP